MKIYFSVTGSGFSEGPGKKVNIMEWFEVKNVDSIDTPSLLVYKERVRKNIQRAVAAIGNVDLLRPHIKTNKMAEVCRMMMDEGIHKFKCATIAEAEMLAMIDAKDVLLAYQPCGPKAERFLQLNIRYPSVRFSCIVDDIEAARHLSSLFTAAGKTAAVFIDLNTGMNRTGATAGNAKKVISAIMHLPGMRIMGLHAYDGHVRDTDIEQREEHSDAAFGVVEDVLHTLENVLAETVTIVSGGSPSFSTHIKRNVECSPGTFVFWDWGYANQIPDQPYEFAALVITRIISMVNEGVFTTDLGHKAVAAENPLPRVHFLNAPDAVPVSQSEEHLVVKVPDSSKYRVGDVLYGVPVHICPTVALYDEAMVVENNYVIEAWKVAARGRKISV